MARATWKGFISFGLVNIPVSLYSGEKRADLQFDLVDVRDQAKIRYQRVNEDTGEEVPWDQIVRAYEYADGNYVLVGEQDFARAAVEQNKNIAVDAFIDAGAIAPYFFEKPYIVIPNKGGEKSYVLLREALKDTGKVGVAKMVIRGRQYMVALLVDGSVMIANRMRFAQELVDPAAFDQPTRTLREYGVTAQELDTAEKLVLAMAQPWQPEKYRDDYRDALLDWIDKKARTGEGVSGAQEEPAAEQEPKIDIMDLLERSLAETRNK